MFTAILCRALLLLNGNVSYSDGSSPLSGDEEMFAFGTNVTLACNDGFVLVGGDGVRTCGDEGEWSGQESTCV